MAFAAETVNAELIGAVKETVSASPGATVKARLRAAARFIGLPIGRVQDYWYGEVRRIEAHEAELIRARARQAKLAKLARLEAEYRKLQAEVVAEAPAGLGWLAPPALGEETVELTAPDRAEARRLGGDALKD